MFQGLLNSAVTLGGQYLQIEAQQDLYERQLNLQAAQARSTALQTQQLMTYGIIGLVGFAIFKKLK